MRHGLADLVEGLLQVARDGEHVADVDHVELLAQVDARLVVVGAEQVGGAPDALRTEAGARPVGGAGVERHAEDRDLGVVDLVDVLDERALQEGSPLAREVRQFAADERGDSAVVDRRRGLQPVGEAAFDLLALAAIRKARLGLLRPGAFGVEGLVVVGHGGLLSAVLSLAGYDAPRPGSRSRLLLPYLGSDRQTRHLKMQRAVNTARNSP